MEPTLEVGRHYNLSLFSLFISFFFVCFPYRYYLTLVVALFVSHAPFCIFCCLETDSCLLSCLHREREKSYHPFLILHIIIILKTFACNVAPIIPPFFLLSSLLSSS